MLLLLAALSGPASAESLPELEEVSFVFSALGDPSAPEGFQVAGSVGIPGASILGLVSMTCEYLDSRADVAACTFDAAARAADGRTIALTPADGGRALFDYEQQTAALGRYGTAQGSYNAMASAMLIELAGAVLHGEERVPLSASLGAWDGDYGFDGVGLLVWTE